jgi:tetratricopeptide (TPR) repeat protein
VREPAPPAPEPEPDPILLQDALPTEAAPEAVEDLIVDPMMGQTFGMGAESLLGLDPVSEDTEESIEPLPDLTAPLGLQRDEPSAMDFEPMTLEGMEGVSIPGFSSGSSSGLDMTDDLIVSLPPADADLGVGRSDNAAELAPDLGADALLQDIPELTPAEAAVSDALANLENRVLDDPENPDIHLELAEKLISLDETDRVAEELELALAGFEDRQDWSRAAEMADRLVKLSPDSIAHHQKRVELAYRMGDRGPLLEAYMGLGDALAKSGALDKAGAVYGRVIEHDPGNVRAAAALARVGGAEPAKAKPAAAAQTAPSARSTPSPAKTPTPAPLPPVRAPSSTPAPRTSAPPSKPPPAPAPPPQRARAAAVSSDDFVDLGSMLRDEESRPRDTRMRVNRREPKDQDEQREFHEILEQFKRGIDENLDSDDYQSHYDLGVAFKEMGLLDEAIGEFQKALRATEGRLRTSEALGMAFFEKGQYAACETILRKAIDSLEEGDDAKIGLLYWLGRASEAQGKEADAIRSYERAMVVDIRFLDLSQRVQRLTVGKRR